MLIETADAAQVWTDRIDLPAGAADAGNDAIAAQLAKRIRSALLDAEIRRATHQTGAGATAVELWLMHRRSFLRHRRSSRSHSLESTP
jgi:hypothetical protein